jgi:hypothetical protein
MLRSNILSAPTVCTIFPKPFAHFTDHAPYYHACACNPLQPYPTHWQCVRQSVIFLWRRENARVWLKRRGNQPISSQSLQVYSPTSTHPYIQFSTHNCQMGAPASRSNSCETEHVYGFSQEAKLVSASTHSLTVRNAQLTHSIAWHAAVFNVREGGTYLRFRSLVGSSYSLQPCRCSSETVATKGKKTSRSQNPKFV